MLLFLGSRKTIPPVQGLAQVVTVVLLIPLLCPLSSTATERRGKGGTFPHQCPVEEFARAPAPGEASVSLWLSVLQKNKHVDKKESPLSTYASLAFAFIAFKYLSFSL